MEQCPWEANSHSASQEFPHILWSRVHKNPSLVPIQRQMNPVHTFPPYSLRFVLILFSHLRLASSEWSLLFSYSDKNVIYISFSMHNTAFNTRSVPSLENDGCFRPSAVYSRCRKKFPHWKLESNTKCAYFEVRYVPHPLKDMQSHFTLQRKRQTCSSWQQN
jgi:hypothetical protein